MNAQGKTMFLKLLDARLGDIRIVQRQRRNVIELQQHWDNVVRDVYRSVDVGQLVELSDVGEAAIRDSLAVFKAKAFQVRKHAENFNALVRNMAGKKNAAELRERAEAVQAAVGDVGTVQIQPVQVGEPRHDWHVGIAEIRIQNQGTDVAVVPSLDRSSRITKALCKFTLDVAGQSALKRLFRTRADV